MSERQAKIDTIDRLRKELIELRADRFNETGEYARIVKRGKKETTTNDQEKV